ncbi:hypothetical protein GCM10023158_03550 [Gluconacetobacter tumulicola]
MAKGRPIHSTINNFMPQNPACPPLDDRNKPRQTDMGDIPPASVAQRCPFEAVSKAPLAAA